VKFRALLVAALALAPDQVFAQQVDDRARAAARTLAEDGVNALQSGDTDSAVDKLERAYALVKLPTVGLWAARALVKSGKLVSAAERYNEVARYTGPPDARQDQAKRDAIREHDEMLPRIPSATIVLDGAKAGDVAVTIDGEPVQAVLVGTAIPVDPKHHVARATKNAGGEAAEQPFDVAEGKKVTVTLKFGAAGAPASAPVATAPGSVAASTTVVSPDTTTDATADSGGSKFWNTQRTIGVAVGGAGVVAAVVSGIFTAGALSKKSDAEDAGCKDGNCTSQKGVDLLGDARSSGNVATITGIAGIAMIGAGVVLFVTAPSPSGGTVGLAPAVLPGGGFMTARGTF
jgi:hypothetical protein